MKRSGSKQASEASQLISQRIVDLDDWRGDTLSRIRALIQEADPDIVEEWKWGIPVWSHDGIVCTGETYKTAVKLTFPKGASLKDPARLFTSSLEGAVRRAVDLREGEKVNAPALKSLILAAVALNVAGKQATPLRRAGAGRPAARKQAPSKKTAARKTPSRKKAASKTSRKTAPKKPRSR